MPPSVCCPIKHSISVYSKGDLDLERRTLKGDLVRRVLKPCMKFKEIKDKMVEQGQ